MDPPCDRERLEEGMEKKTAPESRHGQRLSPFGLYILEEIERHMREGRRASWSLRQRFGWDKKEQQGRGGWGWKAGRLEV